MKKYILFAILVLLPGTIYSQATTKDQIVPEEVKAEFIKVGSPFVANTDAKDVKVIAKYVSVVDNFKYTLYATEYDERTQMLMVFWVLEDRNWDFGPMSVQALQDFTHGADKDFSMLSYTL